MTRKDINWLVEKNDVKNFIKPIEIEIPIDKGQYRYIFNNNKIRNMSADKYFKYLENEMINRLYTGNNYDKYKRVLNSKISLSYKPNFKENNWSIGYSPIQIINAIYETLNIDEKINFFDYNNKSLSIRTKNLIMVRLIEEQLKAVKEKNQDDKVAFINDSINAIDRIFLFDNYDIETRLDDCVIYKNLLYYLSVKSLDILDETDDIYYAFIPKQYYKEVSTKKTAKYPNQLFMDNNRVYSFNYNEFNDRFENAMFRYPCIFEEVLGIDEISVMDKKDYTKNSVELSRMLKEKIQFYKDLLALKDKNNNNIVVSPIKGKNDLYGYYGFVLNNDYIVLDKFYSMSKKYDKIKPACDEAIYSMPLDLFVELSGSKKKMMKYIKDHPKGNVKRNYHTKKCTYKDRIIKVSQKENVSSMNSDWFLNIYTPKKLVLNNNSK